MFLFKKLFHKLLISFLILAISPLVILLWISLNTASSSLEEKAYESLEAVRGIKKQQVLDYFHATESELRLLQADKDAMRMLSEFNQAYAASGSINTPRWQQLRDSYQSHADKIIEITGWYDFFFISQDGVITYSQAAESDLGMSLLDSSLSSSSFSQLFQRASGQHSDDVLVSDFLPYAPSNGDPAAFMMVRVNGNGYLALQIPLDKINQIMQQREGMGETGESYLVGPDKLMRSDSYLDPKGHSVLASFAGSVKSNGVDTEAARDALAGRTDSKIVIDYNGNPVLSAYTPFEFKRIKWALLVEIDESEAFQAVSVLWQVGIITFIITLAIVGVIATYIAKSISGPIKRVATVADKISHGDLTQRVEVTQQDEVGILEESIKAMNASLAQIIVHISGSTEQQSAAAEELSMITEKTTDTVQQQQAATDVVAAAITEMSSSIAEVSDNTNQASELGEHASKQMTKSNEEIGQVVSEVSSLEKQLKKTVTLIENLKKEATDIGGILDVIKGIAEQTNLLALNAAIEAARAGDQGRGFAVVADEVRTLAMNTQKSTGEIEEMIKKLQAGAAKSVVAMQEGVDQTDVIVSVVNNTVEIIGESQQSMQTISDMSFQIATAVEEQLIASNEISKNTNAISELADETGSSSSDISQASVELARLASELSAVVKQFKV